jgi:hypothetical protein
MAQVSAISGIHISFMKVQKGEQPAALRPLHPSDDAKKLSGIAASNSSRVRFPTRDWFDDCGVDEPNMLWLATTIAPITSNQNGAASHHLIDCEKSIANRIRRTAERINPIRSNHC